MLKNQDNFIIKNGHLKLSLKVSQSQQNPILKTIKLYIKEQPIAFLNI